MTDATWHVYSEDGVVHPRPLPIGPRFPAPPRGARVERSADGNWVEVFTRRRVPQPSLVYVRLGGTIGPRQPKPQVR